MPRKCKCEFCIRSNYWESIESTRDVDKLLSLIREMKDLICQVEEENSINKCILQGNWPSADKYAERIMEGYKKFLENENS